MFVSFCTSNTWELKIGNYFEYWYHLVTDWSISPLLSEAYQLSLSILKYWCSEVKEILDNLGFSEVWLYPTRLVWASSVNELSERVYDQYLQRWSSSLKCTSGKLRTYKLFKTNILYEKYLSFPPHLRVPLTRFRMNAHPLRIEVGRYHRPNPLPVEYWICQMLQSLYCGGWTTFPSSLSPI